MRDRLDIDPSRCWTRHVRRAADGTPVLRATFAPAPLEGTNGPQGWQTATPERRLNDDGSLTIRFPNVTGEDGVPHVERFALLTDPAYRPGEEWLEVYREPGGPDDLAFVGTPVDWAISPAELELTCADALVLTANTRASEVDLWRGAAPRDAFEFYTRGKVLAAGADLAAGEIPAGWTTTSATPAAGGGVHIASGDSLQCPISPALDADAWEIAARGRIINAGSLADVTLSTDTYGTGGTLWWLMLNADGSAATRAMGGLGGSASFQEGQPVPAHGGRFDLRMVARGEWLYLFANGELRMVRRRTDPAHATAAFRIAVDGGGEIIVDAMHAITMEPLLARGADRGDHHLPGVPPPGGLHATYYAEAAALAAAGADAAVFRELAGDPTLEPATTRLDATVAFTPTDPPTWQAVGTAGGDGFSVRWEGAIRLDLAASDREARVYVGSGDRGRLWIGGVLLADLTGTDVAADTGSLRAHLGTVDGWYPIRLELAHHQGGAGVTLQDHDLTAAGPFADVPADRLSPVGAFTQDVRHDSARELLTQITEAFGYQWRLEPRTLESGAFPGELVPRVRVGRDTDVIVDELNGQEVRSSGTAADAVDGLLADASGLAGADPDAPALTAGFLLTDLAREHLVISEAYESLAEISEETMLRTRGASLLALRSSPAETIAARPDGQRDLVRTLVAAQTPPGPLQLTGDLARMRWEPGDGVRLDLPGLRAKDLTPRQMTAVAWELRPDGVGPPTVAFRQRPRGLRAVLTRVLKTALAQARAANRR